MRPNDLIWNYWINNYLLGRTPPAFDILYWNADNTRLPAAFHGELLDFFKLNPLTYPNGMQVCGTPIDLSQVTWTASPLPATTITSPRGTRCTARPCCSVANAVSCWPTAAISRASSTRLATPRRISGEPHTVERPTCLGARRHTPRRQLVAPMAGVDRPALRAPESPATELGNASYPPLGPAPGSYVRAR